jgi:hypothetical protein
MNKKLLSLGLSVLSLGALAQSNSQLAGNGKYGENGGCIDNGYVFSFETYSDTQSADSVNYINVGTEVAGGNFEPTIINTGSTFDGAGEYANGMTPSFDSIIFTGLRGSEENIGALQIVAVDNDVKFQTVINRFYGANGAAFNGKFNPDLEESNPLGVSLKPINGGPVSDDYVIDSIQLDIVATGDKAFNLVVMAGFNVVMDLDGDDSDDTTFVFADKGWWIPEDTTNDGAKEVWSERILTRVEPSDQIQSLKFPVENAGVNAAYSLENDSDYILGSANNVDDNGRPQIIRLDTVPSYGAAIAIGIRKIVDWSDDVDAATNGVNAEATVIIDFIEVGAGVHVSAQPDSDCVTSLDKKADAYEFALYPNPASDYVNFTHNTTGKIELEVTNSLGSVVLTTDEDGVDVSELFAGVYFATLKVNGEAKAVRRFMIK